LGAQAAVGVGQELRHEEQRDALDALRRVGQLGQHQVDDVLGEVVLAGGDEDLGAGDR
jgi:hypothetical protein